MQIAELSAIAQWLERQGFCVVAVFLSEIGVSPRRLVSVGSPSTLVGDTFAADGASVDAFHWVVVIRATLVAAGGAVGALGIANPRRVVERRDAREASSSEFPNQPWRHRALTWRD